MKKLSEVTREDAIAILSVSGEIARHLSKNRWALSDQTKEQKVPCKMLSARWGQYHFWFEDDGIEIVDKDAAGLFSPYDVKFCCYLKAHEIGYYVPGLSEKVRPTEVATKDLLTDIIKWEKDLSEYMSLETILNERYIITKRVSPTP